MNTQSAGDEGIRIYCAGLRVDSFKQADDYHKELAFLIQRYDRDSKSNDRLQQEKPDGTMNIDDKYGLVEGKQTVTYAMEGRFIASAVQGFKPKTQFFRQVLYAYLLGNNDLHLRNFRVLQLMSQAIQG